MRSLKHKLSFSAQPSGGKDHVWVFCHLRVPRTNNEWEPENQFHQLSICISWHVIMGCMCELHQTQMLGIVSKSLVKYSTGKGIPTFLKEPRIKYRTSNTTFSSFATRVTGGLKLWEVKRKSFSVTGRSGVVGHTSWCPVYWALTYKYLAGPSSVFSSCMCKVSASGRWLEGKITSEFFVTWEFLEPTMTCWPGYTQRPWLLLTLWIL